jgi:hypothetical protein
MAFKNYWKVLLRLNRLTKDVDDDYIAEVSTIGHTLRREDIAQEVVDEGTEFKYETVLDILARADRKICEHVVAGHSVLNGIVHITPRVLGNWHGEHAVYNKEEHKTTVDMNPGAELNEALKEVGVDVVGMEDPHAFIRTVIDSASGKSGVLTPGFDCIIEGSKIKIAPDDGDGLGVFLYDADGLPTQLKVTQNLPKTLRAHAPADLADGEYTLQVITRYAGGVLLNDLRVIEYAKTLTVGDTGQEKA